MMAGRRYGFLDVNQICLRLRYQTPSGSVRFMAIVCPSCAARHAISEELGYGRMLHCDWCGTRWIARPPAENPFRRLALPAEAGDVSDAVVIEHIAPRRALHATFARPVRGPQGQAPDRSWLKGLGVLAVLVGAFLALGVPLVAALPRKDAPAEATELVFRRVHSETMVRSGQKTLVVEGELVNNSDVDVVVPAIRIGLRSAAGTEVYSWLVEPAKAGLAAGGAVGFRSAISAPPADASQVTLRLADRQNQIIGMR